MSVTRLTVLATAALAIGAVTLTVLKVTKTPLIEPAVASTAQ